MFVIWMVVAIVSVAAKCDCHGDIEFYRIMVVMVITISELVVLVFEYVLLVVVCFFLLSLLFRLVCLLVLIGTSSVCV